MPVSRDLADALIEVVRERMEEQGLSINSLARAMGVQQPTLSRQLRGQGVITLDEWAALAEALGESLEDLLPAGRRRL